MMVLRRNRVANAEAVRELIDSAFAARYQDVAAMLKLSSTAVALAEEKSQELPSDLVVAAWTQYGNALRIAGRYREAERALGRGHALLPSDPTTRIHLLEVTASLHRNTGQFETAAHYLKVAIEAHRSVGDSHGEARTYNILGIVYFDAGDRAKALHAYQAALDLLTPDAPIDVVATTGHNLLETLIADRRLAAAASTLAVLERFFRLFPPGRLTAKTEWMRARLCRELKQYSAARIAYERAYTLLSAEPGAPELAEMAGEMAGLPHEDPITLSM
jgi:tetratricopeptide (TPR) repeat protein